MELDSERCRLARLSRDSRFDGEFFLAVKTTGIYCRPVCPARPPAEKNVRYFRHAAQAAESGYRPCLRCRPESAPNSPAWRGSSTTVQRALDLIAELKNYPKVDPLELLSLYVHVGEFDPALDLFEAAFADRNPQLYDLTTKRRLPQELLDHPRFEAVVRKAGFLTRRELLDRNE